MTEGSSVSVPSVTSETRHFEHRPPALAQRILRVLSEIATPRDYRRKKGDGATAAQLRYQTTQPCDDSQVNSGDWAAIGAVGAAVIAVIALLMSIRSTRAAERAACAAEEQTRIQQQLRLDAAMPYIWADVRPDNESGVILQLVVGNSGPTVATDVRVRIEPPFPNIPQLAEAVAVQQRLAEGFRSLPPGRTMQWWLGQGFNLLQPEGTQVHKLTITATGPLGHPVPDLSYELDLSEYRGLDPNPSGSLRVLTEAVKKLTDKVQQAGNHVASSVLEAAETGNALRQDRDLEGTLNMAPIEPAGREGETPIQ